MESTISNDQKKNQSIVTQCQHYRRHGYNAWQNGNLCFLSHNNLQHTKR
jgi:hypothetical protein